MKIITDRIHDLHSPSSSDLSLLNRGFEGSSLTTITIMYSLGRLQLHHQPSHLPFTHTSSSFPKQSSLSIRPIFQIPFYPSFFFFQISKLHPHPSPKVRSFPLPQVHMHHSNNRRCSPLPQTPGHRSPRQASEHHGRKRKSPRRAISS